MMVSVSDAGGPDTWATRTSDPSPPNGVTSGEINGIIYLYGYVDTGVDMGHGVLGIYNPATDSWTTGASPGVARVDPNIGVINGKMYVVGGCITSDCRIGVTSALEIYDPVGNSWLNGAPMPTARYGAASGVIAGKLYVSGGDTACPPCVNTDVTEIYDPTMNAWTTGASIPLSFDNMTGAVAGGLLYAIGGYEQGISAAVSNVQVYDPVANSWSTGSAMPTARQGAIAGIINGDIYVVGGSSTAALATNESYDPSTDMWTERTSVPTLRSGIAGSVVNSNLYAIDGTVSGVPVGTNEEYTAPTASATRTPTPTATATPTSTATPTASITATPTASATATVTATLTATPTATVTATLTATATATVTATPTATATASSTATATATASATATATPTATSTPVHATLKAAPKSLKFGSEFVGVMSKPKNLVLSNLKNIKLNAPITIFSIQPSTKEFAASQNCLGQLAAGATCDVAVTFTPAGIGHRKAKLVIASNAINRSLSVPLKGIGKGVRGATATPTATMTPTATPTHTGSPTPTATATASVSATPTFTATPTGTGTAKTPTATPTRTTTITATPTRTATATRTVTPTPTATPTPVSIGVGGCNVSYVSGGAECSASGPPGIDLCTGSTTVNIKCKVTTGSVVVTFGSDSDFIVCNATVPAGSTPGLIPVPCTAQPIVQGDCPPGDSIVVGDDNTVTLGQGTVPFMWTCDPGA